MHSIWFWFHQRKQWPQHELCKILGIRKSLNYNINRLLVYHTTHMPELSLITVNSTNSTSPSPVTWLLSVIPSILTKFRKSWWWWGTYVSTLTLARTMRRLDSSTLHSWITSVLMYLIQTCWCSQMRQRRTTAFQRMGWSKVGTRCVQWKCFVRRHWYTHQKSGPKGNFFTVFYPRIKKISVTQGTLFS